MEPVPTTAGLSFCWHTTTSHSSSTYQNWLIQKSSCFHRNCQWIWLKKTGQALFKAGKEWLQFCYHQQKFWRVKATVKAEDNITPVKQVSYQPRTWFKNLFLGLSFSSVGRQVCSNDQSHSQLLSLNRSWASENELEPWVWYHHIEEDSRDMLYALMSLTLPTSVKSGSTDYSGLL